MKQQQNDTIFASSNQFKSAIKIIRISGQKAKNIPNIFGFKKPTPRTFVLRKLIYKNRMEKEIEILQKESNLYRGQKKLFEKAFNDMREEVEYLQPIEEIFEKLISQLDPYDFDMHIKKNNADLEYTFNPSHSFKSNILEASFLSILF